MSAASPDSDPLAIPPDPLATLAPVALQQQAARMAQDAFGRAFRLSVEEVEGDGVAAVRELHDALANWAAAGGDEDARALRLALMLVGMDQWGMVWTRAFGLVGIPALTALIGSLRTGLDPKAEARFQRQFEAVLAAEQNAIDFKVELRRGIHLALWHSAIAADNSAEALRLATELGSQLLALVREMPRVGWRLAADALAHIQIRCLADGLARDGVGLEATQALFGALARELPPAQRDRVMAHATQAVIAWQRASRPGPQVH